MKVFLVLLLAMAIMGTIASPANRAKLNVCLGACHQLVRPCLKDVNSGCPKTFEKCIRSEDPFTCLASANNIYLDKVVQCFDQNCQGNGPTDGSRIGGKGRKP
jgi:hypothetical protein